MTRRNASAPSPMRRAGLPLILALALDATAIAIGLAVSFGLYGLVRKLTKPLLEGTGIEVDRILELGRGDNGDASMFDMTAFSLRMTNHSNAVSQLHAATANGTWQAILGGREILGVTNGVHMGTWLAQARRWITEDDAVHLEDLGADHDSGKLAHGTANTGVRSQVEGAVIAKSYIAGCPNKAVDALP